MKKILALVLVLVCVFALAGCKKNITYRIQITVPAGNTDFVFSEEEISAIGKKITISPTPELGDAEVILAPVSDTITAGYVATDINAETSAEFDADSGQWFKIGVAVTNDTDTDKIVYVEVKGVEIRMP